MTPYYDEDGITIYHGDCLDVLPSVDPANVSLVLTDPPYGINIQTDYSRIRRSGHVGKGLDHASVVGDTEPFDPTPLLSFSRLVLWGGNHYADRLPSSSSWIVWDKRDGLGSNMFADCELAWSNLGGPARLFAHRWQGWNRDSESNRYVHPTQKPVSLMKWIVGGWTEPGDLILDPYMGSGPVAQACHEMGRQYIGIEIEERYCEIAVQRLAQGVLSFDSE